MSSAGEMAAILSRPQRVNNNVTMSKRRFEMTVTPTQSGHVRERHIITRHS